MFVFGLMLSELILSLVWSMLFNLKKFSIFLSLFALQVVYPLPSNSLSDSHKFYLRIHGIIEARRYAIDPLESDPPSYCLSRDPLFPAK